MTAFHEALRVIKTDNAVHYASDLFRESFNSAFPQPARLPILETIVQPRDWHQ